MWCRLHTITLKWPTRQRMSFIWQHRFTFTCIGADRTNGGEKFSILSQSIPWGFSGPSLPQTVQRVLLTKANVKGHIWTSVAGGSGFVFGRGPGLLSPPSWVTEAKGVHSLSEQWPEGRNSTVCYLSLEWAKRKETKKNKNTKMWMYEWSCDGLIVVSEALNGTLNTS